MRFSWVKFNRVVVFVNILYKIESFIILDSLIPMTPKVLLKKTLSKYSWSSKFFVANKSLCGIKKVNMVHFSSFIFHQV